MMMGKEKQRANNLIKWLGKVSQFTISDVRIMQKRQSQAEPKETEVRATAKFQRQADT